ncbi:MAG: hypothetical protein WCL46_03310, partial [Chlorobium sp.]
TSKFRKLFDELPQSVQQHIGEGFISNTPLSLLLKVISSIKLARGTTSITDGYILFSPIVMVEF